MTRAAARRVWEAARARGVKPLSWRLYDALLDAARVHGTHWGNNGGAGLELERKGLVASQPSGPYVVATEKGRAMLAQIADAAIARSAPTIGTCGRCGSVLSAVTGACVRGEHCKG